MYQLKPEAEARWIDVLPGVRIKFRALGSGGIVVARAASLRVVEAGEAGEGDVAYGFTVAAACWGAVAWEGVGDEAGAPLPLTREALAALLSAEPDAYDAVDRLYVLPGLERDKEKNGSASSQTGTSTEATITAGLAKQSAKPARRERTRRKPTTD